MSNLTELVAYLREGVHGDVLTDDTSLGLYATDASFYQITPVVVVVAKDERDVRVAVEASGKFGASILPRGGGTSLAGQTVGNSIVLDFSKYMNRVLEVNSDERWARVQPGVVRDELNEQLRKLHFAPDPATSSRATVGGMVGNNSSGTKSILYGKTVDHVLEARVLLSDGTEMILKRLSPPEIDEKIRLGGREGEIYAAFRKIITENRNEIKTRYPKVMRRVGGYNLDEFIQAGDWNLAKLITGSEGTLAVTLELKLNLEPLPTHKSVAVLQFADLLEAIRAVPPMLPYNPSAVEILDSTVLQMSHENLTTRQYCYFLKDNPAAILIVEFYGDTKESVIDRPTRMIEELRNRNMGYAHTIFPDGKEYDDVWNLRKKGFGLMLGVRGERKPLSFIEDSAVPVEDLPEYIDEVLKICKKHNTEVALYAHASVGVIHVQPLLDLRQEEDIRRLKAITDETFELVVKYKGSWSGEHGDGLVRSAYNRKFFGPVVYQLLLDIKKLFDPDNRMNPGKIVEAQTIEHNLRYGTTYKDEEVATQYHYRFETSFKESVHMCTGVGECRKVLGGTMCPSFKATRDEEHSTRGRANALRLAMSGQLGQKGISSERLHEVMDLCLSCKACKSECPSNVDMAKMKSDVLQLYYDEHGSTLRDRLIRDAPAMAKKFSGTWSGLVNAIQRSVIFRSLLETATHFDKRRTLPPYAMETFVRWFCNRGNRVTNSERRVVFFADTYVNYYEPEIGIAAVNLLNAAGYEVLLATAGCCQRTRISHGFLREAKQEGAATIAALVPFLNEGLQIVVCEPSCASALNDDWPDLIDDARIAQLLKTRVLTVEDFLLHEHENGRLQKEFESPSLLIHGHCHQKALYGTKAMKALPGLRKELVHEIPSGCCGMAGSFGYESEHYEISQRIGESVLFPAVRAKGPQTTLVANGFSCRHQIEHFTGVKPVHWVQAVSIKSKS